MSQREQAVFAGKMKPAISSWPSEAAGNLNEFRNGFCFSEGGCCSPAMETAQHNTDRQQARGGEWWVQCLAPPSYPSVNQGAHNRNAKPRSEMGAPGLSPHTDTPWGWQGLGWNVNLKQLIDSDLPLKRDQPQQVSPELWR